MGSIPIGLKRQRFIIITRPVTLHRRMLTFQFLPATTLMRSSEMQTYFDEDENPVWIIFSLRTRLCFDQSPNTKPPPP